MPESPFPAPREMTVAHRWLNFPISAAAPHRLVEVFRDGRSARRFFAQLAPVDPDWWAALDVGGWGGAQILIRVADAEQNPALLSAVEATDESNELVPELYREPGRPLFHFSARRGWLNDPNGLVFCDGQYHLFFQHTPFSWSSASKHWGHAVSPDLVHWHEMGEALYPDLGGQAYSGSAVVDCNNTSGLVAGAGTPLVLLYTNWGQTATQCLAYTKDGIRFDKFAGNPLLALPDQNRDPKIFWHEDTQRWIMALYVGTPEPPPPGTGHGRHDQHSVHLLISRNLRDWEETDVIKGGIGEDKFLYECPDLFPLPVDGRADETKWVFQGGSGEYFIGSFDGRRFIAEGGRLRNCRGSDFYAPQTFNNVPGGRVVQIGWMRAPSPGMPFNQCLSVPLELSLRTTGQGVRLFYTPVGELEVLRDTPMPVRTGGLERSANAFAGLAGDGLDIEVTIKPGTAQRLVFGFSGTEIRYDVDTGSIHCGRHTVPLPLCDGVLRLRILVDRTTIDLFGADGAVYLPLAFLPVPTEPRYVLVAVGGSAEIVAATVYPMRSSWER